MADFETQFKDRREFMKFCKPYEAEAYTFVLGAVDHCQKVMKEKRHISGRELLLGIRDYGIREYGPMTKEVFDHWGIRKTDDFGAIVFKLIDVGLLARSDTDSINDFKDVYDFKDAFKDIHPNNHTTKRSK
jgi:uncharacterized repeat protein (TIGR04138 family)